MIKKVEEPGKITVFLGFDGFIDRILKPVREKSEEKEIYFKTIQEFAEYLQKKKGKSCSIDMVTTTERFGGNMPNVAHAMGTLGCRTVCVGAMGEDTVMPLFEQMNKNCRLITVNGPGYCSSLEFEDGKLMLSNNRGIENLDYKKLIEKVPEEELIHYLDICHGAAFLNWGELIKMNDIWKNILERILPRCSFERKKVLLIDFSDFSKRSREDIYEMIRTLEGYAEYFDITVSLNDNEEDLFFDKLELKTDEMTEEQKTVWLSQRLPAQNLVVHRLDTSSYVKNGHFFTIKKEVVEEPQIITGGGDNFNAGLLFGLLTGCGIEEAVKMGAGLSCLYVRHGKEASLEELEDYIDCSEDSFVT